jgi:hypothetical protein
MRVKMRSRDGKRRSDQRAKTAADQQRKVEDVVDRSVDNLKTLLRQAITADFTARMRNQLALELLDDERVIDDAPVLIYRGDQLGVDAAGSALPEFGLVIATNYRIRFATVDDPTAVDAPFDTVRLTHDEDGALTLVWSGHDGQRQAATIVFKNARVDLIKQLRALILEPDKHLKSGPATPRVTTWDRIRRQRRR